MSDAHEVEIKRLLVDDGAAERFVAALRKPVRATQHQVNHVFDTDDGRLARSRHAVRLRVQDGDATLTAKGPGREVSASTSARLEAETTVEDELVEDLLAGRIEPLCVLRQRIPDDAYADLWRGLDEARACRPLRADGRFENTRRVVDVTLASGLQLTVEVDETHFPNARVDHEVEIEVPGEELVAEVEAWLDGVARDAAIETRDSTPKIARFHEALRS